MAAGDVLTIVDLDGNQAVDCLLYAAADTSVRYSAADTIARQQSIVLTTGSVLRADTGAPLMTVVADEVGVHDTIGGACSQESNTLRYGQHTREQHACVENFLLEGSRWGLGKRDLVSNINWFMNVPVDPDGALGIVDGLSAPGKRVALRAEVDTLVLVSNCPQINNPCNGFNPTPVRMIVTRPEAARELLRHPSGRQPRRDRLPHHRSARKLGLRTVAVFSDADRGAPHVRLADEAVRLGPAPAKESYLRVDAILAAAIHRGRRHPPRLRLPFRGRRFRRGRGGRRPGVRGPDPRPAAGLRHQAHRAGRRPGRRRADVRRLRPARRRRRAVAAAAAIGFPLMLKATGGGGGIGMTVCRNADELADSFPRVARLAGASFGTAGVFAERYVENARHVEVQIFGDGDGRVVSLGDRDCSLQRRHQKVLEEAPAPDLPDALREELHRTSRALCASVGYRSAGTVEFVYDAARQEASFLEVNARLQVEHPVTEAVTGVDLVAWMLRLARAARRPTLLTECRTACR